METLELENYPQLFPFLTVGNKIMFILRSSDEIVSSILVQSKQAWKPKITKTLNSLQLKVQCELGLSSTKNKLLHYEDTLMAVRHKR